MVRDFPVGTSKRALGRTLASFSVRGGSYPADNVIDNVVGYRPYVLLRVPKAQPTRSYVLTFEEGCPTSFFKFGQGSEDRVLFQRELDARSRKFVEGLRGLGVATLLPSDLGSAGVLGCYLHYSKILSSREALGQTSISVAIDLAIEIQNSWTGDSALVDGRELASVLQDSFAEASPSNCVVGQKVLCMPAHGDFVSTNIGWSSGLVTVFDFEYTVDLAPRLTDLAFLIQSISSKSTQRQALGKALSLYSNEVNPWGALTRDIQLANWWIMSVRPHLRFPLPLTKAAIGGAK